MLTQLFKDYWLSDVKEIAVKCTNGFSLMYKIEKSNLNEEEKQKLVKEYEALNIVDDMAVWHIGLMIGDIEKSLYSDRPNLNLINSISAVNGCLNSESYWTNVWNNDYSSEEATNLKELAILIKELTRLL